MSLLVVTPTLGESRWLAETVASVAAHARNASHVLVAPAAKIDALSALFPGVQVGAEPREGGMYAAINAGAAAGGDWRAMTYLNDDDLLLPGFSAIQRCSEQVGADMVYGGVRLIDQSGRRIGGIPISRNPALNRALYAQRIEPVYQHGTVVSRSAWERLGGFDSTLRFCGDSEFLARATLAGVRFVCGTSDEVAAFRVRAGQLTKNRDAMIAERRRVDEKLGLVAPRRTFAHHWARFRFRGANLPIYLERILRHGFVSFDELLTRVE